MDAGPFDALPETVQGQEINPKNGQVTDKTLQLAPTATLATDEVLKGDRHSGAGGRPTLKRAGGELLKDRPEVKRRNQRLFGTLLGTLQKFKKEEDAAQASATALRRAAMLQAAEEKTREASTQYPEKHKRTKLGDNRSRPEQRYENGGTGHRRPPGVPFLLKTSTEPSLSWAPRESCPEIDALLAKQRKSEDQVEKKISQDIDKHRASAFLKDGSGDTGREGEEGEVDKEKHNEHTAVKDKKEVLQNGIAADAGPHSGGKDESSNSDSAGGGGGWRVVEDPTAEAFK
ncbi:hypothetical protein KSW81_006940 [Nannochloris sp. 'desiccata']|nr:hypothetical protein KSW81_006940 [Chlorella desiccata (nom. nud.)]